MNIIDNLKKQREVKMMKHILLIVMFLWFSGCGGSGSTSTTSRSESFNPSVQMSKIVKNDVKGNILSIDSTLTFKENNSYFFDAVFANISPSINGCSISNYKVEPIVLNGGVAGKLHIELAAGCSAISSITFKADEIAKYLDNDVVRKTGSIEVSTNVNLEASTTTEENTTVTSVSNGIVEKFLIFPSSLTISQPNQKQKIVIYTLDSNNRPISATINMNQLVNKDNKVFGSLSTYKVITSPNDGMATVEYTSPSDISDLNTTEDVNFSIDSLNKSKTLQLSFNQIKETETKIDKLLLSPSQVAVTSTLEEKSINIYTLDENNTALSAKVIMNPILIDENNKIFGFLNTNQVITDKNGKAVITYTTPKDIKELGGNKDTIFTTNDTNATLTLKFEKYVPAPVVDKLVVNPTSITVTQSSQKFDISIYTLDSDNRPLSETVLANFLIDDKNKTFGELSQYNILTNTSGKAVITFTAPLDINIEGTKYINLFIDKLDKKISIPVTFNPTTKATLYAVKLVQKNPSFQVDTKGNLGFKIVKQYDDSLLISDVDVNDVNISSENHLLSLDEEHTKFNAEYNLSAEKSFEIWTGIHSGIDFLDVNASVFDGEKNITINEKLKVVVVSGAISSISVNYLNTKYDTGTGLYIENYAIHAVDKYSNPATKGSKIYFGAVNNEKVFYENNGTIYDDNGQTKLDANDVNFSEVKERDTLIVFPDSDRKYGEYLGGWLIDKITDNGNGDYTLELNEPYTLSKIDNLDYVIGNERRYDVCYKTIALVDVDSADGTYEVDKNGIAYAKLRYDPYLIGKTVALYANAVTDKRVGTASKTVLRGEKIIVSDNSTLGCETNSSKECKVSVILEDSLGYTVKGTPLRGTFIIDTTPTDADASCKIEVEDAVSACNGVFNITLKADDKDKKCYINWTNTIYTEY
jgi:hypothetical protein